jgi:hypothetical protein
MVMSKASVIAVCRSAAWIGVLGASLLACPKDEPPPPLPAAPKAVEPVAEAPLELKPEDAGKPPEPAAVPKTSTHKTSSGSLATCCAALRQNAVNAPEPNKGYMTYAAQLCDTAAASGKDKASIVGVIQTTLKGAGLPTACK